MRQFFVEIGALVLIALYIGVGLLTLAWFTFLPTIGILWSIGWLK